MQNDDLLAPLPSNEVRYELRQVAGKTKAGKLNPIMAVPFLGRESGMLTQTVGIELAPVAGRMISQIFAEVVSVAVPIQAVDLLRHGDTNPNAGITEVLRRRIMDKETLFYLEPESEISKRMGIVPRSISGSKQVSAVARIAHNAAVNFLRKKRYIYASEVAHDNLQVTPSIINETVLDRFLGVLEPDEHANGAVGLDFANAQAPLKGKTRVTGITQSSNAVSPSVDAAITMTASKIFIGNANTGHNLIIDRGVGNPATTTLPIFAEHEHSSSTAYADLGAISAGTFSLTDLYNAEKADRLIRQMRALADSNAMDGEDAILRWAFGLSADSARYPFEIYRNRIPLKSVTRAATDGVGMTDETMLTYGVDRVQFSVPVPKTELGCIVITFLSVTPDEVIDQQPHPILSDNWTAVNHASNTMRLDPEPVTYRDLYADIPTAAQETGTKFFTGANALKKTYVNFGFNRHVDPTTVEAKTVLWQYAIPAGVTPENILYPANLSQYPFLDQLAEIATYDIASTAVISTPTFFGPTPVEKLAIVDDETIFG